MLDSPLPTSATGAVHLSNGSRHGGVRVLHAAGWAHSGITRHGTPTSPAMRRGEVGRMTVHDEREHQSAYVTSGGRRFRALYNPTSPPRAGSSARSWSIPTARRATSGTTRSATIRRRTRGRGRGGPPMRRPARDGSVDGGER